MALMRAKTTVIVAMSDGGWEQASNSWARERLFYCRHLKAFEANSPTRNFHEFFFGFAGPSLSTHRCSLFVPIQIPCECRVQIDPDTGGTEGVQQLPAVGLKRQIAAEVEDEEEEAQNDNNAEHESRKQSSGQNEFSVVRQNLLGPLSFDDLYYIS